MKVRPIELLAPAKNAETALEAIKHGADAIYMGAPAFSARSAATNSIEEIQKVVDFAHLFHAKVYIAFNTLIFEEEIPQAEELIGQLYSIGVDALIIQDMGILKMNIPPIPLHASTQMDNRTIEKVQLLEELGFEQVVLARELSLPEIRQIAQNVRETKLEVFVHGSLCNGISGQCYLSQSYKQRSANRGNCAQMCRLPYHLVDANDTRIVTQKHLLSPKDLNRSEQLEALLDAGVSSFKIEGRLKETNYVKNITAYYRQKLDQIFARNPEYRPASSRSKIEFTFKPNPIESFNRGFTDLQSFHNTLSIDSPKSIGSPVGSVKSVSNRQITVAGIENFANGDGLCFVNERGELQGFRVNRADENRLFPSEPVEIKPKTPLFRNYNHEFEKLLSKPSAERKIELKITLVENDNGFHLTALDSDQNTVSVSFQIEKQVAQKPQREQIVRTLTKLGDTPFVCNDLRLEWTKEHFIPSSILTDWRRQLVEEILQTRAFVFSKEIFVQRQPQHVEQKEYTYLANIANSKAVEFFESIGATELAPAFELEEPANATLLFSKHCIKRYIGYCPKENEERMPYTEPLSLINKEINLELTFDCKECIMKIHRR